MIHNAIIMLEAIQSADLLEGSNIEVNEDESFEKKVSLAEKLNWAEILLNFVQQEVDSNFSDIVSLCKLCM